MEELTNTLYYGDNLKILREYLADQSIDLIYLDPPFNSNRNYNVLFKDESGQDSESQLIAFEDTWHWDRAAEETYHELVTTAPHRIVTMIGALRDVIGTNQILAYLVMMTIRLIELHRVLKPTGSLYLHCDPTASHYLKIVLDTIFGVENFRNEIIWYYSGWVKKLKDQFASKHDIIFFYAKSSKNIFHSYSLKWEKEDYLKIQKQKVFLDEDGREYIPTHGVEGRAKRYLDDALAEGRYVDDVWQISSLTSSAKERLGYPTQKPLALLERIIQASSSEGDLVLDPFCGCGTTIHAAHRFRRKWVGIDITHLAIALQKYRLKSKLGLAEKHDYQVIGEPEDLAAARQLAQDDRYQFQWWALSLIQAQPLTAPSSPPHPPLSPRERGERGGNEGRGRKQGKKGKDQGIDGIILFLDDPKRKPQKLIVQVKSGKVSSKDIRDLAWTVERENAAIGVFLTLERPTKDMRKEALAAGFYHSPNWHKDYPKIQILTIEELLAKAPVKMPPTATTYQKGEREHIPEREQGTLL